MAERYIGLISGTSMDAADAVLVEFNGHITLIACHRLTIDPDLRQRLLAANRQDLSTLTTLDIMMGDLFARAALGVLAAAHIEARQIRAIGSHGQTVFHRPTGDARTSVQIGDPNLIAERTGITTVADFRRRDLAAGGQGAPLVPAFHAAVFRDNSEERVIVNVGGIANVTVLPRDPRQPVIGFDTGPGNCLMDEWAHFHLHTDMDDGGRWAASGRVLPTLLSALLHDPYFSAPTPKSTGREYFHRQWLEQKLAHLPAFSPADVQATLCELTAVTVVRAVREHAPIIQRLLLCGGGAHNHHLRERISASLPNCVVDSTAVQGIEPDWVEATAFAWLAKQTIEGKAGNLPSVTGAHHPVVLGGIYQGSLRNDAS